MNRIFITGAGGYLGLKILSELAEKSTTESILGIVRKKQKFKHKKVSWLLTDLNDISYKDQFNNYAPNIVIHTAWDMKSQKNLQVTRELLQLAFNSSSVKKIIYLSSIVVYGTREKKIPCMEEDSFVGGIRSPYGIQKVAIEKLLNDMCVQCPRDKKIFVLRPVGVYEILPRLMSINRLIPFPSSLPVFRQFLHTQDLVDSVGILAEDNNKDSGITIYNLAPPPIYLRVFYMPTWFIKFFFAVLWKLFKYERTAPGKWRFYLHTPLVDGSKGAQLLRRKYRVIPIKNSFNSEGKKKLP